MPSLPRAYRQCGAALLGVMIPRAAGEGPPVLRLAHETPRRERRRDGGWRRFRRKQRGAGLDLG